MTKDWMKAWVYLSVLLVLPMGLILNLTDFKSKFTRWISAIYVLGIVLLIWINPIKLIWLSSSTWKTQTILYRSKENRDHFIAFQLQDKGALGYNRRRVKIKRINGFLNLVTDYDSDSAPKDWIEVNENINEVGLKGG